MKILIFILALLLQHRVFSQSATNDSIRKQDRSDPQNIKSGDDDMIFMKCEIEPSIDTYIWKRHQDKQIKEFLKASKEKQKNTFRDLQDKSSIPRRKKWNYFGCANNE